MVLSSSSSLFVQITIPKELNPNLDKTNNIQWNVKSSDLVQKGDILGVVLLTTSSTTTKSEDKIQNSKGVPGKIIRAKKRGRKTDIAAATKAYSTTTADTNTTKVPTPLNHETLINNNNNTTTSRKQPTPTGISRYLQNLSSSSTSTTTTTRPSKVSSNDRTIRSPISGIITIYTKCQSQNNNNNNNNNNHDDDPVESWVIAKVEACTHSTVMDGLCVICGKRVNDDPPNNNDYNNNDTKNNNNDNQQEVEERRQQPKAELLTVSGGVTVQINNEEARRQMADATLQKLRKDRKLQLVLDIDHTLLHATADPNASYFYSNIPDCKTLLLPIQHPQTMKTTLLRHYVKLRPYICELFLSPEILNHYEISIYTAGTRNYAEQVTNILCRYFINYKRKNSNIKEKGCCLGQEQLHQLEQALQYAKARYEASKQTEQENEYQKKEENSIKESSSSRMNYKNDTNNNNNNNNGHPKVDTNESTSTTQKDDENQGQDDLQTSNGSKKSLDNKQIQEHNNKEDESEDSSSNPDSNSKIKGILRINKKRRRDSDESDNNNSGEKSENAMHKRMRVSFSSTPPDIKIIASRKCQDAEDTWKQLSKEYEVALDLENQAQQLRRQIFGSRIISRTDVGDLGRDVKSLQRVFPCGGKMAVIVDDREDVWANGIQQNQGGEPPPNLLVVKPYHWKPFLGFADVNNAAGADITRDPNNNMNNNNMKQLKNNKAVDWNKNKLMEHQKKEEKEIQLKWIKDILIRLHERFYISSISERQRDQLTVSSLLKQMRLEVLGCPGKSATNVVFSGLVPLHRQQQAQHVSIARPPVVRYAQDLGATVLPDITKDVTHVIAARDGTDKLKKARETLRGCAIVHVSWLMDCYWSMSKQDVKDHWLGAPPLANEENHQKRLLLTGSDDSEDEDEDDDDDDDDFATEFENDFMEQS